MFEAESEGRWTEAYSSLTGFDKLNAASQP
jgi:hypothetical protein